ncbi:MULTISPECIES: peptidylprolyl isomerase [Acidobacteriaceae]|uniref:peptidylprolyl isomerase n=1 Tax=Acidobacteriaceae TaxID=204434 RepID=UPI00131C1DE6|nr:MULTISPECIES: peptidyl-prolyl cis-trans isomerase [Acidobacteriaceae]MDW5264225.1 peptidylprolyl isomerase [Edaphobacter sp.]
MTFRISQFAVVLGLSVLALPGVAQMPRYQSPVSVPEAPQPQLSLPTPAPITPNATVVEDVVARVNDQIINRSDVERAQQELVHEDQQANATPADAALRQKDLLRDMIDKQLLLSKAKELGLNADAEVIRRLDEIRKQNHLDSMEALEKAAASQNISFEDFKANIRDSILTQQVVRDEVGRRLQMTQGQEQTYYDAHKQDFSQPEQVRLSEILIPTAADANDAALAAAKAKADDVEAKLKAGAQFDELAKTESSGSTAAQGGDLGEYKRGGLKSQLLEDQTFSLKAGEVTAPIRTRQGYLIMKVTEHQYAGTPALKDVEPQVQEAMYMEQLQPALRTYLTRLREEAFIDLAPGFVDSGASANESKPLFTAYAAPVAKKKKVQKKQRYESNGTGRFAAQGKRSSAAPAAAGAAATATPVAAVESSGNGKHKKKKIKREKIRFGRAPRNALPAGPEQTAVGGDVGAGAASASAITAAPGAAMTNSEESAAQAADVNPLTPTEAAPTKKTRYASREKIVLAEKKAARSRKVKEKAAATPVTETAQESADQKTQAAPLGLNGDTAKKKKKKKRTKGEKKERLENKAKPSTAAPPPPAPTVNPSLGQGLGSAPAPAQPTTPPAPTTPN